jgi:general secretion pathway protein J
MAPRQPACHGGGGGGTTLIELLVGLSLLSLMAVLLLGGMHLGLSVWESGRARQNFEQQLERTDSFLRQLLGESSLAIGPASAAQPGPSRADQAWGFLGGPSELRFMALLPYQLGSAGRYAFELSGHTAGQSMDLVLAWARMNPGPTGSSGSSQKVLLAGIRSLRLAYFGRLPSDAGTTWHDGWSGENGLPALIRLDLFLAQGPAPDRMTLYFAPRFANGGG